MRLDDVRVIDLTRHLPGPYATQLLSDLGADVIKVEDPSVGDESRHFEPEIDGEGGVFVAVNRGKRSVALDLKDEAERKAFYRLVETADVVIEGFRPGVADRLGVGYEDVREHNADVVYCSLSGYGQTGPYSDRPGHDINYVGYAGLLDTTRESPEDSPIIPGYPVADMAGGLFAAFTIVSGLRSDEGLYVDVGMSDVVASFSQYLLPWVVAGETPDSGMTSITGADPWYDVYETADGEYVTFAAHERPFFEAFCEAVDRPDLLAYHASRDEHERERLREELETLFASRTSEEWEEALGDVDATVGQLNTPAEMLEDPHFRERGLVREDLLPGLAFPASSPDVSFDHDSSVPGLGEHTQEVLAELGVDESLLDDEE